MSMPETDDLFSDYFQIRSDTFFFHYNNTRLSFDVESLHQMRVEIKKLRAYLSLLEFAGFQTDNIEAYRKNLSRLFKPGGKLRETQVNKALLNNYPDWELPKYIALLDKLEQMQIDKFRKVFNEFKVEQLEQHNTWFLSVMKNISSREFEVMATDFVKHLFDQIVILLPNISSNKVLHRIRMYLKVIGYVLKILIETRGENEPPPMYILLKEIEEWIGDWHDIVVFRGHIKRFLKKNAGFEEKPGLLELRKHMKDESKAMVVEIGNKFKLLFEDKWFDYQN